MYGWKLEAALQLHKEAEIVTFRDKVSQYIKKKTDAFVGVNYAGQGRYSCPHKVVERGRKSHQPLSMSGSVNCDDQNDMLR